MSQEAERLDRIEALLESVATKLDEATKLAVSNERTVVALANAETEYRRNQRQINRDLISRNFDLMTRHQDFLDAMEDFRQQLSNQNQIIDRLTIILDRLNPPQT